LLQGQPFTTYSTNTTIIFNWTIILPNLDVYLIYYAYIDLPTLFYPIY